MKIFIASPVLLVLLPVLSWAAEAPEYDRPGIGFSTSTVGKGVFAWEQGLPDGSRDHSDGVTTTTWTAATLVRAGFTDTLELQLGADSWGGMRVAGLACANTIPAVVMATWR